MVYMCVADGVGSWREFGIDPRLYAFTLVENAKQVVDSFNARQTERIAVGKAEKVLSPTDIVTKAWEMTNNIDGPDRRPEEEVVGSSTISVASIDLRVNQLYYSNIGTGLLTVGTLAVGRYITYFCCGW